MLPAVPPGLTPATPLSQAVALYQDLLEEMGRMKAAQSRMEENIRMIRETLGVVSCCRCPQEAAGPSPRSLPLCHPATPAPRPWVSPGVKGARREEQEGCPKAEEVTACTNQSDAKTFFN